MSSHDEKEITPPATINMATHDEKNAMPTAAQSAIDPRLFEKTQAGQNPLTSLSYEQVKDLAESYVNANGVQEYREHIIKGALVAKDPASES